MVQRRAAWLCRVLFPVLMLLAKRASWYLVVRGVWLLVCPMVTYLMSEEIVWSDTSIDLPGFAGGFGSPSRNTKR